MTKNHPAQNVRRGYSWSVGSVSARKLRRRPISMENALCVWLKGVSPVTKRMIIIAGNAGDPLCWKMGSVDVRHPPKKSIEMVSVKNVWLRAVHHVRRATPQNVSDVLIPIRVWWKGSVCVCSRDRYGIIMVSVRPFTKGSPIGP